MPLYDYKCKKCNHVFEIQQKITEDPLRYCPQCKGAIVRLISPAGIIFKGSGFHVTDYGKKHDSLAPKTEKKETKPEKKETPKTESPKSESKEVSK